MRQIISEELIRGRVRNGFLASDDTSLQGAFLIHGPCGQELKIIACDGKDAEAEGWEHVSVSLKNRTPNWAEMSYVKDLFWGEEELVLQFHPPKSNYVNLHPNCLHLWRLVTVEFPLPPILCV